jgi:hypothetical protein
MATIGLIGSGHIGGTVARLAVDAGHDVVLSNSRGPETLADLVAELGDRARAATPAEAAAAGDIVVVTVPLKAYRQVPVEPLRGKVVIDTNNYYPQRDETIAELEDESTTVSELLQAHLPESHVVKAFNNIHFSHLAALARPAGDPERGRRGGEEGRDRVPRRHRLRHRRRRTAGRGLALPARHRGVRRSLRGPGRAVPRQRARRDRHGDGARPRRRAKVRRHVVRWAAGSPTDTDTDADRVLPAQ